MKWILLLAILAGIVLYLVLRYKKHIQTAIFMYRTYRKMKAASRRRTESIPEARVEADTEMLKCPSCGKWIARSEAVKLKSDYFCSLQCLEEVMAASRSG
ncbi:MAG: hypothetical protein R2684_07310 [Pyrinomonadaceae bacterium]